MKTTIYNPSPIELEFANVIRELKSDIQNRLKTNSIVEIEENLNADNPALLFKLKDKEGDKHEIVINFIQRIDE